MMVGVTDGTTRDDAAFVSFFESAVDAQVRRAYLLLGDKESANDVVQDAMVGLYRRWADVDEPAAYLTRSVINGCRDAVRRRVTRDRATRALAGRPADRADHDVLTDVLAALPFPQRAALVLRYYGGLTTADIAQALDCAPGSVGPWIERGLAALRKELS
jgi:RNA polymerase sigma factor (sigma-70 family)